MSETTELPRILPCSSCGSRKVQATRTFFEVRAVRALSHEGGGAYQVRCWSCRRVGGLDGQEELAVAEWNDAFLKLIEFRPALVIRYRNWRGEEAIRRIIPLATEHRAEPPWHPEPTWLLDAWDCDKRAVRSFAMDGIQEFLGESWQKEARDA